MGKTNGLAIAAMVLGILGFCVSITAPIALILGIVALNQIGKTGEDGRGMALTGIILGAIVCVLTVLWLILNFALGIALM